MRVFINGVYEKQRLNIERLAREHPDDWFFKSQMEKDAPQRTGFAPINRICWRCKKDITKGEKGITVEDLGDDIITGCPHCHRSFCE